MKKVKEERRRYERPRTAVVELQQRTQLLTGSMTGDRGTPYGAPVEY